jgi:peptidoglycan hydrolase-like protein with peptidoglycan-binding domain
MSETQNLLGDLGYNPGPADGVMGPRTRAAVIQFQLNNGLSPDGRVSNPLLLELRKEAGK